MTYRYVSGEHLLCLISFMVKKSVLNIRIHLLTYPPTGIQKCARDDETNSTKMSYHTAGFNDLHT
jgi:hypothetical protein